MKKNQIYLKIIRILQHFIASIMAFCLVYLLIGTSINLIGVNGEVSYNLYESDRNKDYEDSYLFNNILGNNISDVFRLIAIRSQLETDASFDENKKIDVTAYVNRGNNISADYITAVYNLSDLLKWAQKGFEFESRSFADDEAFLASSTTYTHINNNSHSGGMNSYLNSGIDGNSLSFTISGNSSLGSGTHNILINEYQTVDGKNIEDIVSDWNEYSALTLYVQEAANDLLTNYGEYYRYLDYFDSDNSNLKYYVSRTIDSKTEVYTNVPDLSGDTTGKDIKSIFSGYGKYIYYCPYEIKYETNTLISEKMVRDMTDRYKYAYPDQIKVYFAVDNALSVSDIFSEGSESFNIFMPYKTQLFITGALAAIIYVFLTVIYLSAVSTIRDAESIKIKRSPEIIVLSGLVIMILPLIGALFFKMMGLYHVVDHKYLPLIASPAAFVMSIGFLYIIYELGKGKKSHTLWKNSLIRKLCLLIKKIWLNICENANAVIRSIIPYILFIAGNIVLFRFGILGICIATFVDIITGIFIYRQTVDRDRIIRIIENIKDGDVKAKAELDELHGDNIKLAKAVNSIGEGFDNAVGQSMRDEKLKADLITNVSHDIKTPLTSIINYVDLIKREDIDNPKIKEYVDVLDKKSQKLKQLTEDLVEASKISSGNISIELSRINLEEMVNQTLGEFYEKFEEKDLKTVFTNKADKLYIKADAKHLWRVFENLFNNVYKYSLGTTRVYLDLSNTEENGKEYVKFELKNISAKELNIKASELTERFIRGDESRTTEGSGLGLSIAENLTSAQGGSFNIDLDGDLFKVTLIFEAAL